jgi:DNA mismatch repair protein MutL
MTKIKVMNPILSNKIAAGEVVEKIASVVKELVENSIDALSTEIKIELIESGVKEIKVIDNGTGMNREDAVLAFERHATSKLFTDDDLFHINTLGFRGEALPSIASVSKVTLKTGMGEIGTIVSIDGGHLLSVDSGDARKGTIITVKNLFYNTPARLKHMKSLYTELANVTDYINKIALSHPNIRFTLKNDENVLINTDGSNNLLKTIKDIFGLDVAKKMISVRGDNEDYSIDGYISLPEVNRSNRNSMVTIVNGRVIRNMDLNRFINDSYHSYKPDTRYPIVVLNITADTSLIDVNVHPTKMDVKFSKTEELGYLINDIIKKALKPQNLVVNIETLNLNNDSYNKNIEEMRLDFDNQIDNNFVADANTEYTKQERFPIIYPVGLVNGTYIVCQNESGMYLIDQHAAKERVNYEYYKDKLGKPGNDYITMLIPITIELTANEFIIIKENINFLKSLNFNIEEFGISSIIIKSHPNWIPKNYEEQAIRNIIEIIVKEEKNFSIEKFNENTATNLSCKLAIKANENISLEEMENLINDLRQCDNPFNCPHGRPTIIHYSKYELEKLFKRSGFN